MANKVDEMEELSVASLVEQAKGFQGTGLFTFVLQQQASNIAEERANKQPSPLVLFEEIFGVAFRTMWKKKKEMDDKQRTGSCVPLSDILARREMERKEEEEEAKREKTAGRIRR